MGMPDAGRCTVNTRIMSILCNAMQFKVQCRMPDPDGVRFRRVNPSIPPAANPAKPLSGSGDTPPSLVEGFERPQLFGLAASIAARLTIWPISLACSARAHLRLDIFAVQPHHFRQILGVQQLFGIVQRGLHVLFGVGYRLGADVLRAGANGCTSLLERSGGLLCAGQEFIKGLAGLLEARLGHRSHILWNLETVTPFIAHGATPFLRLQGHSQPRLPVRPPSQACRRKTPPA